MSRADARFVKGLLLGILANVGNGPALIGALITAIAIAYLVASAFTKEPSRG